jgi:hypothetical protein
MTQLTYFILISFFSFNVFAFDINCEFEEVYADGSVQNGTLLISDEDMRYQYDDQNLFTIFKKKDSFYFVEHANKESFKKLPNEKALVLNNFSIIAQEFPDIRDKYLFDDMTISLELKNDYNFVHRISILSNALNMSVYFYECKKEKIDNKFLQYFPYHELS